MKVEPGFNLWNNVRCMGEVVDKSGAAGLADRFRGATHSLRPARARHRARRAARRRFARSSMRRWPNSGSAGSTTARSSGSPAGPRSRWAPSTPTSTARRRCSPRWSATCRARCAIMSHPRLEGAIDGIDRERRGAGRLSALRRRPQGSLPDHRRGRVRRSRRAFAPIMKPLPRGSPRGSRMQPPGARSRDDGALANEVRAWAIMGMNVFLGLRFGVWGQAGSGPGRRPRQRAAARRARSPSPVARASSGEARRHLPRPDRGRSRSAARRRARR